MKIYTKTGDDATSSLFGGTRVDKHHLRLESYGTLDELNAFIAVLIDAGTGSGHRAVLRHIQRQLFSLGALLATEEAKREQLNLDFNGEEETRFLEKEIDQLEKQLPELKNFILPGGHPLVSHAHVCRTVSRRAERLVSLLHASEPVDAGILAWLNRLSDYFFVLGRALGRENGVQEIAWKSSPSPK